MQAMKAPIGVPGSSACLDDLTPIALGHDPPVTSALCSLVDTRSNRPQDYNYRHILSRRGK